MSPTYSRMPANSTMRQYWIASFSMICTNCFVTAANDHADLFESLTNAGVSQRALQCDLQLGQDLGRCLSRAIRAYQATKS